MQQKIFHLGLSVEAISVYMILEELMATGNALNVGNVKKRWVRDVPTLESSLQELTMHSVVNRQNDEIAVRPASEWSPAAH